MRPVSATRKPRQETGRASVNRRSGARAAAERPAFGQRKKFRNDPVSRFFRDLGSALSLRRPSVSSAFALLAAAGFAILLVSGVLHRAIRAVDEAAGALAVDAGFGISAIHLSGNRYTPPGVILAALGFAPGQSIFRADVQGARATLLKLDWVAGARVSRRYPDAIYVRVVEKVPFALWSSGSGAAVVDREGDPITRVEPSQFSKLPLFLGDRPAGAAELMDSIALHRAVAARVRAMQRVSGRRWNLILDDGVLVKLPEQDWAKQLDSLERLIVEKGILERDIAEIDLRSRDNYFFVLRSAVRRKIPRGSKA